MFTFEQFLQHSLFQGRQAAVAMRVCSGQTRAEFALFARLRATRGTTNRQRFLLCDFHAYTMRGNSPIKMVNCDHFAILREAHYLCRKGGRPALEFAAANVIR
ncbi:hypothetical protein SBA1_460100 [Candidatus Sulfotelmatobacter kueseliae]|uniref:Uncharacterized protein n=1 Tax=Candidatus Sulfotelmatobacter kueseliae TaxID=2042962 RepID=A0A2U3KS55_9BACT|nr:hypothetical protein SBA1_460100 [Candidatus Sulfotelmatobacter kueseliae]